MNAVIINEFGDVYKLIYTILDKSKNNKSLVKNTNVGEAILVVNKSDYGVYPEYKCLDQKFVTVLPTSTPLEKAVELANYFAAYSLLPSP